jgi:hypothetical protein
MFALALLTACTPAKPEPGDDTAADTSADTAGDTDTAPEDTGPEDTDPVDLDGDGHPEGTDCDDRDPDVFPGAEEVWNERDDDCDGVTDADGTWTGTVAVAASAVYEGRRYDYALACPFAGDLADGRFSWVVTCVPDPADAVAQLLLGATLTVIPKEPGTTDAAWDGAVEFASSNGWDSDGDGTIRWSSFDGAQLEVQMGGVSLSAAGSGPLVRE